MTRYLYGVDFGGSTLKAVCTDEHGGIIKSHIAAAGGRIPLDKLVETVRNAVKTVSVARPISHIGLAFGGAIQPNGTMIATSTNLPNLAGVPLISFFETVLACKVRVENDARAAMRGEAWSGAARDIRNAMTLTFGTGIGSGVMLDGKILNGAHGKAGEIGVWQLDHGGETYEDACAPGRVERVTGKRFAAMFASGEAEKMVAMTGRAMANAHLLLDLDAVILLGGITELGEALRQAIETSFKASCPGDYCAGVAIRIGEHGALAGAVGAASLWREIFT